MKKFIAGFVSGALIFGGASAFAASGLLGQKVQGIYTVVKNGVKVADGAVINGTTYVPVRAIADATGAKLTIEGKKIIINGSGSSTTTGQNAVSQQLAENEAIKQFTDANPLEVVQKKGLVKENGTTVLYAYDRDDTFIKVFNDQDSMKVALARMEGTSLPPLIADGWLDASFLAEIYGRVELDGQDLVVKTGPFKTKQVEYHRFSLPDGFNKSKNSDIEVDGVKIKTWEGGFFFSIAGLQKLGLLK